MNFSDKNGYFVLVPASTKRWQLHWECFWYYSYPKVSI